MKIKVDVTERNIELGLPHRISCCPIALALRDSGWLPIVGIATACLESDRENAPYFALPKEARRFILDFDNGEKVEPFSFELDLDAVDWSFML